MSRRRCSWRLEPLSLSGRVPVMRRKSRNLHDEERPEATSWPAGQAPRAAAAALTRRPLGRGPRSSAKHARSAQWRCASSPKRQSPRATRRVSRTRSWSADGQAVAGGVSANRISLLRMPMATARPRSRPPTSRGFNSPYGMCWSAARSMSRTTDALLASLCGGRDEDERKPGKSSTCPPRHPTPLDKKPRRSAQWLALYRVGADSISAKRA